MRRILNIVFIILGLGFAVFGVLAGLFYLGLPIVVGDAQYDLLQVNTVAASLMTITGGGGLLLAWVGWSGYLGRPSPRARLPHPLWLLVVFGALFVLGIFVLQLGLAPWLFPPLHVVATVVPPLFFVLLAAYLIDRRRPPVPVLDLSGQLAGGMLIAAALSVLIELVLLAGLLAFVGVLLSLTPGGLERIGTLFGNLRAPELLQDPAVVQTLFSSPVILAAAGIALTVGTPLIEAASKTISLVLVGLARRRPTRTEAFLWGVVTGAGFAITGNMISSVSALPDWGGPVLLRVGSALVQVLTGGLLGLGWYAWLSGTRRWRWGAYFGLAVALQGIWNGAAGLATLLSAPGIEANSILLLTGGALFTLTLLGLFVIEGGLFGYLSLRLGQQAVREVDPNR
jgi:hypothetical protein